MTWTTVPKYNEMIKELFEAVKELGGSGSIDEIDQKTIEILKLPEEIVDIPHGDTNITKVEYRLAWARTYLKKAGYLENSSRGIWALTAKGQEVETVDPKEIVTYVRAITREIQNGSVVNLSDDSLENDGIEIPEEVRGWRKELQKTLIKMSPAAFERLAQRLLREAGFIQVNVTGRTGDGGIDGTGMVKLNGIISFHMLFQCKRYQGSVSASELRDFRGAMQGRADKGLFITTGKFTSGAIKEANRAGTTPIDLMDGNDLTDKLKELGLGIKSVVDYKVDESWFESFESRSS